VFKDCEDIPPSFAVQVLTLPNNEFDDVDEKGSNATSRLQDVSNTRSHPGWPLRVPFWNNSEPALDTAVFEQTLPLLPKVMDGAVAPNLKKKIFDTQSKKNPLSVNATDCATPTESVSVWLATLLPFGKIQISGCLPITSHA
jgi:hypothetical protein